LTVAQSKLKTARHEAGHSIMALYTGGAMPLHRVTIIPRGHSLGSTLQLPEMDRDSESFLELRARIDVAMGGRAAEELLYGRDQCVQFQYPMRWLKA
jgi:ATP-dependent metalloprotease